MVRTDSADNEKGNIVSKSQPLNHRVKTDISFSEHLYIPVLVYP